jgi:hypothetical protein
LAFVSQATHAKALEHVGVPPLHPLVVPVPGLHVRHAPVLVPLVTHTVPDALPVQSGLVEHPRHVSDVASQTGCVPVAVQPALLLGSHAAHEPAVVQMLPGRSALHSTFVAHGRHVVDPLQNGVVPLQPALLVGSQTAQRPVDTTQVGPPVRPAHCALSVQPTHVAVDAAHTGVAAGHTLVAAGLHAPHAPVSGPLVTQTLGAVQSLAVHARQVPPSQMGVVPLHCAFIRHCTQRLLATSQV